MNLTEHFTLEELYRSATATALKIDNVPGKAEQEHLKELAENLLEPLRKEYGRPIKVTSGYRSKALNESKAVGGSPTSSHRYGYAADIKPVGDDMPAMQAAVLRWALTHTFDQIILEQPVKGIASWIHVGWKRGVNNAQRKQVLKAQKVGGKWQYTVVCQR